MLHLKNIDPIQSDKDRKALWNEDYSLRRAWGPDTVEQSISDFSLDRFYSNMSNLNFGHFRRPVGETQQPDMNNNKHSK